MSNKRRVRQIEDFIELQRGADGLDLTRYFAAIKTGLTREQEAECVALYAIDATQGLARLLEFGETINPGAYEAIVVELERRKAEALAG